MIWCKWDLTDEGRILHIIPGGLRQALTKVFSDNFQPRTNFDGSIKTEKNFVTRKRTVSQPNRYKEAKTIEELLTHG